jgi:hypothetical protein
VTGEGSEIPLVGIPGHLIDFLIFPSSLYLMALLTDGHDVGLLITRTTYSTIASGAHSCGSPRMVRFQSLII